MRDGLILGESRRDVPPMTASDWSISVVENQDRGKIATEGLGNDQCYAIAVSLPTRVQRRGHSHYDVL